jgi:hypothetical protein
MKLTMQVRDPKDALESPLGAKLRACESRIRQSEGEGLLARWEFGRTLLPNRQGQKDLPNGLLALICQQMSLSRREVQQRMRFAEKYPDKAALRNAVAQWPTWHAMTQQGLVHRAKARRKAPPPPGRFTMELYRFAKLLAKIEPARLTAQDLVVLENLRTQCTQKIEAAQATAPPKETHA